MAENTTGPQTKPEPTKRTSGTSSLGKMLEGLFKLGVVVLAAFIVLSILFVAGRAAVYKIHEYERGLHLRGGRFVRVEQPGWHIQIPLVDTVIIVTVSERLGYVEQIPAMTSDDVTMNVSLQYTYRVTNPERFALDVADPERIVFEFVQGKLRDVVNTKPMTEVMHSRAAMNQEVMVALQGKEEQYGVSFVTVQIQSASPPPEVVTAIKDRMVAVQRQEQAQAEAAQRQTLADADFYVAQKEADANAYRLTQTAEAEARRIALAAEAQQQAVRAMLAEMRGQGALAEKYIDYLIAQELKDNSKWVIGGGGSLSILDLGGE
jgi:regulator of protease activity HflC (stomatin/prohibitin superfamily)